jgi:type VI secretion system protein ImpA
LPAQEGGVIGGPLRTRAEALQQLRAVADFFRHTEPHSPVAYLADRAAQWGDMPLHDWLRAVVKDQAVLATMQELLGVPAPPAKE